MGEEILVQYGLVGLVVATFVVVAAGAIFVVYKLKENQMPTWRAFEVAKVKKDQLESEVALQKEELTKERDELAALKLANAENQKAREQFEKWEAGIKQQMAELGLAEADIKKMYEKKKEADEEILNQQKLLNETNAQLQEAQRGVEEIKEAVGKLEEQKKELDGVEAKLNAQKTVLEETETTLKQKTEALKEIEVRRDALIERVAGLEGELKALEGRKESLEKEIGQLDGKLSGLKDELQKLTVEKDQLKNDMLEAGQNLQRQKAKEEQLDRDIQDKETKFEKISEDLRKAKDEVLNLKSEKERLEKLLEMGQKDLEERKRELGDILKSLEKAMQVAGDVAGSLAEATGVKMPSIEERLKDFNRLEILVDPSPSSLSEEELGLENCRKYLERVGFRYSDRVLNSFHTALKINEYSALTVLAGISGTGKSQLPRLYAEALGIHFLSLPVQPRWDSPQDLLGFYNYVENRFKATPLSRALRQFDKFGQNGGGNLRDEMLLVLLDEMNLARIEYYFSEFLSRLENRELPREDDEDFRRKCEILIEAGPKAAKEEGAKSYRAKIYPGFNVFFVGTMNEDESTLSLSDKVLDRANVLRFGRPEELKVSTSESGVSQIGNDGQLPYGNWREWVSEPLDAGSEWGTKLHQLNKDLDGAGKPFGHRVFRGILAYIANYPDKSGAGQKNAFADQLEIKILPKLRGLEIDNPQSRVLMESLQRVIEETDDTDLFGAFEESKKRADNSGFFSFLGVQR